MKDVITITKITVNMEEMCEHNVDVYLDKKEAISLFNTELQQWLDSVKSEEKEYNPDFDLDKWICENIQHDIESDDCILKHFVTNDGYEKIFELKIHTK